MLEHEYALAIFALASESNIINQIKDEIFILTELLKDNDFNKVMNSLSVSVKDKKEILNNSLIGFSQITLNFLSILLDNKCFYLINDIYNEYEKIFLENKNTTMVDLYSCFKLSNKQIEKIKPSILNHLKLKDITINNIVDETLIGGIKVIADGKVLDLSAKSSLANLKKSLWEEK